MLLPPSSSLTLLILVVVVALLSARLFIVLSARRAEAAPIARAIMLSAMLMGYGVLAAATLPSLLEAQTVLQVQKAPSWLGIPLALFPILGLPLVLVFVLTILLNISRRFISQDQRDLLGESALAVAEAGALLALCLILAGGGLAILPQCVPTLVGAGIR